MDANSLSEHLQPFLCGLHNSRYRIVYDVSLRRFVCIDVRLLWCQEPKLSLLTQVPECGAGPKALGKFLFIGRQAGANQTSVGEGKAKLLHFLFGFLCRPTLPGHTVGCNHHSRAVVPQTAVDENLLAWILSKQCKELRKRFIFWKGALPGHRHVLHPEMCYDLA